MFPVLLPALALVLGLGSPQEASGAKADDASVAALRAEAWAVLEERCIDCHGSKRQRGGLRVDRRRDLLRGGDSGKPAFHAREADASELLLRVKTDDVDLRMPYGEDALPAEEVSVLERWIAAGAPLPADAAGASGPERVDHWAYLPPKAVAPPNASAPILNEAGANWSVNPIDRFVLARLEREGLAPAREADRATLLRRLSFDLIGLPPTVAEVEAYVNDTRPDAYERVVERLLASPHYGERWARHWLDLARYADSDGHAFDNERSVWPYRDWVVDALNADMPFDRFTLLQLAGDIVPGAGREGLVASGFHRNTMTTEEAGTDDEEFRIEAVKNRVETTGTIWLGSTLNCAQCHDHKYDPFSLRDYYRLFDFFNHTQDRGRSREPMAELPTDDEQAELDRIAAELKDIERVLTTPTPELKEAQVRWEADRSREKEEWQPLVPERAKGTHGSEFTIAADGILSTEGLGPEEDVYVVSGLVSAPRLTAIRLEAMPDPSLPSSGPGRGFNGNFVLTDFQVFAEPVDGSGEAVELALGRATASYEQDHHLGKGPIADAIDEDPVSGWGVFPQVGIPHEAVFTFAAPLEVKESVRLTVMLHQKGGYNHTIGRLRLSLTGETTPRDARPALSDELEDILARPAAERTDAEKELVTSHFLRVAPELKPLLRRHYELRKSRPRPATTLVMQEVPQPRQTRILLRGDFLSKGAPVTAGFPGFLDYREDREPGRRLTRVDLARWLTSADNPLTARVTVNRHWQRFFGRGLVDTSNDFGTRGSRPSHPELLDWLAETFRADGWSLKTLHRRIVTSRTYRQATAPRAPDTTERDVRNVLLARQSDLRLEGETIRDAALLASGLLSTRLGGPPVYPPVPSASSLNRAIPKPWPVNEGSERYRRSLYTWHWRTAPMAFYATFDAPPATVPCTQRRHTTTPLQALTLANDRMMVELAHGMAYRVLALEASDAERVRQCFLWALSREPRPDELEILTAFLADQRASFGDDVPAALELLDAHPIFPPNAGELDARPVQASDAPGRGRTELVERAAWTALARVLFNLSEFVTRG